MTTQYLKRHEITNFARKIREWIQFFQRDFSAPSPNIIKMKTLMSFATPSGNWVETGTYLGGTCNPISEELFLVAKHKQKFTDLVIFIDDVRLFPRNEEEETGYPKFQFLIDWCRDNAFEWQIQNDILIAKMRS